MGWRRRAASAVTCRSSFRAERERGARAVQRAYGGRGAGAQAATRSVDTACPWPPYRSLQQVDGCEQGDPDHVDEVPVVRRDDRAGGLRVAEPARQEGAADDEQERDQAAGDVQ